MMTPRGQREQVLLSVAKGNVELMHEYFTKHLRMGTATMKVDKSWQQSQLGKKQSWHERKESQWPSYKSGPTVLLRSLLPEAVDELLACLTLHLPSTAPWGVNVYKPFNVN